MSHTSSPEPGTARNRPEAKKWIVGAIMILTFVAAVVQWVLHRYEAYVARQEMSQAFATARACEFVVTNFFETQNRFPRNAREAGCSDTGGYGAGAPEVAGGQIVVEIKDIHPDVNGRHVILQAVDDSGALNDGTRRLSAWRCSTDIPDTLEEYKPRACESLPLLAGRQ